jgi:hypothetical protein
MIAIFRQYVAARHRFITAIYVAAFASVLISQNANATYVAAMFNENIFVIGTDSRRLSSDGRIVSDEACKIILLNDSSAFVLMGAETWTPNNAVVPRMNFYDIARTTGAPASLTLNAAASRFGDAVVERLNLIPPALRRPPPAIFPTIVHGVFGGLRGNTMTASSIAISYSEAFNSFGHGNAFNFVDYNKPRAFVFLDVTGEIVRSPGYKSITDMISKIEYLIQRIIDQRLSNNIGGHPVVLVLEKGKRPRWHRGAGECPNVD